MRNPGRRSGISAVEVIVLVIIVAVVALAILMSMPRQREAARGVACKRNLMLIGKALATYEHDRGRLPTVTLAPAGPGPLATMLADLGVDDFLGFDTEGPPTKSAKAPKGARLVPGFICPADPNARAGLFPAPVSYRGTAGDRPDGGDGIFAPGGKVRLADVTAGDGLAYTSAFAERLLGDGRSGSAASSNYALCPGPITSGGCPPALPDAWSGDAGSSWRDADWRSTLYNHALTPDAAPSCIAFDGRSALIGASSGHPDQVHALMLDGSVRPFTPAVNAKIWRMLANPNDGRDPE